MGNVGQAPEMQYLPNEKGTAMVRFSLAVPEGYGDNQVTHWFNCTIFGKRAEAFNEYVQAGRAVIVEGTLGTYDKNAKEGGNAIKMIGLKVSDWSSAGAAPSGSGNGGGQRQYHSNGGGNRNNNGGNRGGGNYNNNRSGNQGNRRTGWNGNNNQRQQQPASQQAPTDDGAFAENSEWNPPF